MSSTSIVYTNENCIGCNKCINVCSAIGACVSTQKNGKPCIEVDGSKCVACGSCIDVCVHGAREFQDDTEAFFQALERGEQISLLLAPAFKANYPAEYEAVLGGLKSLGINRILSVSFGADITTWGYLNYIRERDFVGGISQPCPAVVSYIERYLPELLPKLFPVQSPLMCAAIYARTRKELGITDQLAFISPCIAKKLEIEDEHNAGLVQYNVTFEHLMRYVRAHGISGNLLHSEVEYGLGAFYPTPGGLAENVRWFLGDQVFIRQVEGERQLYEWLQQNNERIRDNKLPFLLIDALNCERGCICGTAVDPEKSRTEDALLELLKIREERKKETGGDAWSRPDPPKKRLENFNRQFAHLKLSDYLRGYTDRSAECRYELPDEAEKETIFRSMNKMTEESRKINCTCCGYESCEQMQGENMASDFHSMKRRYIFFGLTGAVLFGIGDWLLGFVDAGALEEAFDYLRIGHAAASYRLLRPMLAMALGAVGALFYYPCFIHMGDIVTEEKKRERLNFLFGLSAFSLVLIHYFYSIIVFVYAWMAQNGGEALAGDLSIAMDGAMNKGVMVGFFALWLAQIILFVRVVRGQTNLKRSAAFFHPMVWMIVLTLIGTVIAPGHAFTYGLYTFGTNGGMIIWLLAVLLMQGRRKQCAR